MSDWLKIREEAGVTEEERADVLRGAHIARDEFGMERLCEGVEQLVREYEVMERALFLAETQGK